MLVIVWCFSLYQQHSVINRRTSPSADIFMYYYLLFRTLTSWQPCTGSHCWCCLHEHSLRQPCPKYPYVQLFLQFTPHDPMQAAINWKNRLYALLHVHVSNYSSSFGSVLLPYDNWKITETTKDSQQLDNQIGWNFYGTILFMEIDKNIYHKFGLWSVFLQRLC